MNIFTFAQISGGFTIIFNKFFYYLLLQEFRCRINQKSIKPCFLGSKTPKINIWVTKNMVYT